MENIQSNEPKYQLGFHGKGSEYFGVVIVNWLLTMVTLGFYYPWAKARQLRFLYGATSLNNDPFAFHGTGKEMFKGFIKTILIFAGLFAIIMLFSLLRMPFVGFFIYFAGILAIIPLAIHGSYRYRMSRTSWRGIRFGYRGDRNSLIGNFFMWLFLTLITLGIYGSWMSMNLRKYLLGNVRLGSLEFKYDGDGGEYFWMNLKGYLLTLVTLGIYSFWWQRDLFEYYINNITAEKDGQKVWMRSTATGGDFFALLMVNLLILVFTLGIGYAWIITRTMSFITSKIEIGGNVDLNTLSQTEENYSDATGEDLGDYLDLNFIM